MSVIAEFDLDSPILREALSMAPGTSASIVQETVPSTRLPRITFWCENCQRDRFEEGLRDDPTVEEFVHLAGSSDRLLYRITITESMQDRLTYSAVIDLDGTTLNASGDADGWRIRVRFPDREAVAAYQSVCEEQDIGFQLRRLYTAPVRERDDDSVGLTAPQQRTLELAVDRGYFQIPRKTSATELADELDISTQAVSERLRRAYRKLATGALEDMK